MSHRIAYEPSTEPRQRRPRIQAGHHLEFIRCLPCVITGTRPVDPAHLRAGNRLLGKRPVGVGEKPSDVWVTPLSRALHDQQHLMNELWFWKSYGIDNPWQLCLALFAISGNIEAGEAIIYEHRKLVRL